MIPQMTQTRRAFLTGVAAAGALAVLPSWATGAADTSDDWPAFRGEPSRVAATTDPGPAGMLKPLWVFETGVTHTHNPIVAGDAVFVLGDDDNLWALDRVTGAQRWVVPLGGTYNNYHSVPTVAGGMLYTGSATGVLFALDPATGRERWRFETGDMIVSPPLVAGGLVFAGSNDGFTYALAAPTGAPRWKSDTGPIFAAAPTLAGESVIVGTGGVALLCLDAATGARRWTFTTQGVFKTSAVSGGLVFAPSMDGRLYALDAETGAQRWASPANGPSEVNSPAVLGSTVVASINSQGVFAFDAGSGRQLWARTNLIMTSDSGFSAPVIGRDAVYVSVLDRYLATLDLKTGATREMADLVHYTGASALAGGILYVAADDGNAYAFGAAPAGAKAPIPLPPSVKGVKPSGAPLSRPPDAGVPSVGAYVRSLPIAAPVVPVGIAFDQAGHAYLADSGNDRILVFDQRGDVLHSIGSSGSGDGQFRFHDGNGGSFGHLAVGPDGSLFVADAFNGRLLRFGPGGRLLARAAVNLPTAIAIDPKNGLLYAADSGIGQILVFDLDLKGGLPLGPSGAAFHVGAVYGLAVAADSSLWLAESDRNTAVHVDKTGKQIAQVGRFGIAGGRFNLAGNLTLDRAGNVYVGDYFNARVQVFDREGTLIGVIGGPGDGDGQFRAPTYIAFSPDGLLYVSDEALPSVQAFSIHLPGGVAARPRVGPRP